MDPVSSSVFIVDSNGLRIPVNPKLLAAVKKFVDEKLTGQITLHMKSGGVAGVEDRTVY